MTCHNVNPQISERVRERKMPERDWNWMAEEEIYILCTCVFVQGFPIPLGLSEERVGVWWRTQRQARFDVRLGSEAELRELQAHYLSPRWASMILNPARNLAYWREKEGKRQDVRKRGSLCPSYYTSLCGLFDVTSALRLVGFWGTWSAWNATDCGPQCQCLCVCVCVHIICLNEQVQMLQFVCVYSFVWTCKRKYCSQKAFLKLFLFICLINL